MARCRWAKRSCRSHNPPVLSNFPYSGTISLAMTELLVNAAVEGNVDEAVLARLLAETGARLGTVYGKGGKPSVLRGLKAFDRAAEYAPWVVLLDLDHDASCAPEYRKQLQATSRYMCLRLPVREVESWLLADRENLASFLRIRQSDVPRNPETLPSPKLAMGDLARGSRSRDVAADMVPRQASGRKVGPLYNARLMEFALALWQPNQASAHSDSLGRAMRRIDETVKKYLADLQS